MDPPILADFSESVQSVVNNCQAEKTSSLSESGVTGSNCSDTEMESNDTAACATTDPSSASTNNEDDIIEPQTNQEAVAVSPEISPEKESAKSSSPADVMENASPTIEDSTLEDISLPAGESSVVEDEQSTAGSGGKNDGNSDVNDPEDVGQSEGCSAVDELNDRPFTCHLCLKTFKNRAHIIYHLRYHPTKNQHYKCQHCDKVYKYKRNYELHVKVHTFPYVCNKCSKGFNWKHHLVAHIKRFHGSSSRRIRCSMCPEFFSQKFAYMQHARIHNDSDDISEYPCDKCSKVFRYKALLLDHSKLHDQNKIYACDLCPRICLSLLSLERHKTVHSGFKHFKCEKCDKGFTSSSSYQRHWKVHLGIKYKCEICLKSFTQKSTLNTHMGVHNDDRPFCCEFCYKAFASNCKLVHHLKSHSSTKSYECENCSRAFSTYYSLLLHRKVHMKGQSYTNEYILREYNRSKIMNGMPFNLREYHSFMWGSYEELGLDPFEENNKLQLPLDSENSWVLNMDLEKVHSDPKTRITFVCPMCDSTFYGKSEFIYHIRSHPEVLPLLSNVEFRHLRPNVSYTPKQNNGEEVRNTVKNVILIKPQPTATTDANHFLGDHFLSGGLGFPSTPGSSVTPQVQPGVTVPPVKPARVYPSPMVMKEEIKEEVVDHSYGA